MTAHKTGLKVNVWGVHSILTQKTVTNTIK